MTIKELDAVAYKVLKSIPNNIDTAQYSTIDQLKVLLEFARKLKLEDASDIIQKIIK